MSCREKNMDGSDVKLMFVIRVLRRRLFRHSSRGYEEGSGARKVGGGVAC